MWWLTKANTEMKREHWAKRWNWSSCTKLALRASSTQDLLAQSVRASERNWVVVGSSPTQANFLWLLLKILQWWISYKNHIYIYIYIYIYICILGEFCVKESSILIGLENFGIREFPFRVDCGGPPPTNRKMRKNLHLSESPPSNIYTLPIKALPHRNITWNRTLKSIN